jgi:RNA polymerase sigma-70 factor (ECF subfamily)
MSEQDDAVIETELRAIAAAQRYREAATRALELYGDELLGYLVAMTRDQTRADDAFSMLLENLWRGLPKFRWECTFRAWSYRIARNCVYKLARGQGRVVPLEEAPEVEELAQPYRTRTLTFLRTESRDRLAALRASLDPDDQTLLILRINRKLPWRDIARVFDDGAGDDAELARKAATLRKRFERLKDEIRAKLGGEAE